MCTYRYPDHREQMTSIRSVLSVENETGQNVRVSWLILLFADIALLGNHGVAIEI